METQSCYRPLVTKNHDCKKCQKYFLKLLFLRDDKLVRTFSDKTAGAENVVQIYLKSMSMDIKSKVLKMIAKQMSSFSPILPHINSLRACQLENRVCIRKWWILKKLQILILLLLGEIVKFKNVDFYKEG